MDALDERWVDFLFSSGYIVHPIPNHLEQVKEFLNFSFLSGLLLSGGPIRDGTTEKRDQIERTLIDEAVTRRIPLIGVCRGMQVILSYFGYEVIEVQGHIGCRHFISERNTRREVNSFHKYGIFDVGAPFQILAKGENGVIESIKHADLPIAGLMWHPEREMPYAKEDILLFQCTFGKGGNKWSRH